MTDRPEPLVSAEVDVRDLDGFMLNVERLISSELWALSTGEEFKAALALWCKAWKQTPAASLPDNERVLAHWAGVPLDRWREIGDMAMRGFVLCADGRYYHKTLAEDAARAWEKKKTFRARSAKGNAKRWHSDPSGGPSGTPTEPPAQQGSPENTPANPKTFLEGSKAFLEGDKSDPCDVLVPPQGQGQGQGQEGILTDPCPEPGKPVRTRAAYPSEFEEFWKPYPTDPNMSKSDAAKAWAKLTKDDRASAVAAIPGFVAYCRANPDYRPVHAVRFLTSRRFEGFAPGEPNIAGQLSILEPPPRATRGLASAHAGMEAVLKRRGAA